MITIFTIPKPFAGRTSVIQRNALRSWVRLDVGAEVIAFAEGPEVARPIEALGVHAVGDIALTDLGTPLVSDAFDKACLLAKNDILCYSNCDIIFTPELAQAAAEARKRFHSYVLVGQRTDLEIEADIDFADGWERNVREQALRKGRLHPPQGIDYFVFSRDVWRGGPPFAVGRPLWDNWFIYDCRSRRIPVIDASDAVLAVHQTHGYEHVPSGERGTYEGPEAAHNRALAGPMAQYFHIRSATWVLRRDGRTLRALDVQHLKTRAWNRLATFPRLMNIAIRLRRRIERI